VAEANQGAGGPPAQPPHEYPPILFEANYAEHAAATLSQTASIDGGHLLLSGTAQGTGGYPFSEAAYRDVVVDASVALLEGDERTLGGLFIRQSASTRYVAVAWSSAGYVYAANVDGTPHPVAEGPLTRDIPFRRGLGEYNRITLVALGPSLIALMNGAILFHLALDERYAEGHAGLFLAQASDGAARIAARWVQIRAVLADQP
jgi:hypothetical protein